MKKILKTLCFIAISMTFVPSHALACEVDELTVVVSFKAKAGQEKAVEEILHKLTAKSATEAGTIFYAPYFNKETNTYYMLERYINGDAAKTHSEDADFKAVLPKFLTLLSEPIKVVPLSPICPK